MGNDESTPIITKFTTCSHRPLKSGSWELVSRKRIRKSIHIITISNIFTSATLSLPPVLQSQFFPCPRCRSPVFDGGLNKTVVCRCSLFLKRSATGRIMQMPISSFTNFASNFEFQSARPSISYIPELITLNIGVFKETLPQEFISGATANFSSVFDQFLSPFFTQSLRCIGIGDYFSSSYAKFKVLGSFPNYGLVTENTIISCSSLLSEQPISRVHMLPISPSSFSDSSFASLIQPYFRQLERHIHTEEYIFIEGSSFMVTTCEPPEGLVTRETQFYFAGQALEPIQYLALSPFLEDLTYHYNTLSQAALVEEIVNKFVMPYFQGFKRIVGLGQVLNIEGVAFKVIDCWPVKGVTVDSTVIEYDGSLCQREGSSFYGPGTVLIRRGNVMEDPLYVLSQQMFQMQQIMMDGGGRDNHEGLTESEINSFPQTYIDELSASDSDSTCMVCLCAYEQGETYKTLTCRNISVVHRFHSMCIDEWLRRSKLCPLCKRSVLNN